MPRGSWLGILSRIRPGWFPTMNLCWSSPATQITQRYCSMLVTSGQNRLARVYMAFWVAMRDLRGWARSARSVAISTWSPLYLDYLTTPYVACRDAGERLQQAPSLLSHGVYSSRSAAGGYSSHILTGCMWSCMRYCSPPAWWCFPTDCLLLRSLQGPSVVV